MYSKRFHSMIWGRGGVSQRMTDDTDNSFRRGVTIYFDNILLKNIDLFINLHNFGQFMYFKGTRVSN